MSIEEPELTCPHIDKLVLSGELTGEAVQELSIIRDINSKLRYGLWHEKARADEANAEIDRLQRESAELRRDKDHIAAEKAGIAKNAHSNVDYWKAQYEAAEAEVKRLQAELALSKPLYSRRQIEARVKLLEAALRPFTKMAGTLPATFGPDHEPIPDDEPVHVSCCGFDLGDITVADLNRAIDSTGGDHHADK